MGIKILSCSTTDSGIFW